MSKIRLLIIHTSQLVREILPSLFNNRQEIEVVAICASGPEAIIKSIELIPDVVLMDARLEEPEASQTIRTLNKQLPQVKILLLANSKDPADLIGLFKAGSNGYISEKSSLNDLIEAISFVKSGGVIMSSPLAEKMLADYKQDSAKIEAKCANDVSLTERERQILCHLVKGASNKEIASLLNISSNTVKVHIRNIMEKLQVHNRMQATLKGRSFIAC